MRHRHVWTTLASLIVPLTVAVVGFLGLQTWQPWMTAQQSASPTEADPFEGEKPEASERIRLSAQARANLKLIVKPIALTNYWRIVQMPGTVVDRPGLSDCGVPCPVAGVITRILAQPGDTVQPGAPLFTVRLNSELVQNSQAELYKAAREIEITQEQLARLRALASGAISQARITELENQERRLRASVLASRQELLTRGLTVEQINAVAEGRFVSEITIPAPDRSARAVQLVGLRYFEATTTEVKPSPPVFEVKELRIQLGEQVQAGQTLCVLADHHSLLIEGYAFNREAPVVERAAREGWPVRVLFAEGPEGAWQAAEDNLFIRHLANTVDPVSRTFTFYLPLVNQSRSFTRHGQEFLTWRFRPGQRVRLFVPVEELKDIFVLPVEAVVREGPEAYVFRQNGDLFERKPVHIVHEDRSSVILANDGSIGGGQFIVQNAGAALNRALKAQAASGDSDHDHHGHD